MKIPQTSNNNVSSIMFQKFEWMDTIVSHHRIHSIISNPKINGLKLYTQWVKTMQKRWHGLKAKWLKCILTNQE